MPDSITISGMISPNNSSTLKFTMSKKKLKKAVCLATPGSDISEQKLAVPTMCYQYYEVMVVLQ